MWSLPQLSQNNPFYNIYQAHYYYTKQEYHLPYSQLIHYERRVVLSLRNLSYQGSYVKKVSLLQKQSVHIL